MAAYYEIRVAGMLPIEVLLDFELLRAAPAPVETVLHGPLPDQAALAAFLTRLEENREIAPVDHLHAKLRRRFDQHEKCRVQLGRATCDIECGDFAFAQNSNDEFNVRLIHHLATGGAGVDVTVHTGLVAAIAQIDLQRLKRSPRGSGKVSAFESR